MAHSREPPSQVATALDSLLSQTQKHTQPAEYQPACCCGSQSCGKIEQSQKALDSLETSLRQAAQIGHALLSRYDNFVTESEEERSKMILQMKNLEVEKSELEKANTTMIEENRYLLNQLESLNNELAESGNEIGNLNTALESTQNQLDRFNSLSSYTAQLETQVAAMEVEQARLQARVSDKDEEASFAFQTFKDSNRKIADLTEQIERVEKDYYNEQLRHQEVVARFERQQQVQKELQRRTNPPPGPSTLTSEGPGSGSVVSSFVKEILQDNANLQMGIIELREMLVGSNDEVQALRERALVSDPGSKSGNELSLKTDLSSAQITDGPFHVHHHYHTASKKDSRKEPGLRRPKKKRYSSSPGFRSPVIRPQTPYILQSPQLRASRTSSSNAILSQTSVSIPPLDGVMTLPSKASRPPSEHHFKGSSSATASLSSSFQEASVFDLAEDYANFSRPTTPASTSIGSPKLMSRHSKQGSDTSVRSFSTQSAIATHQNTAPIAYKVDRNEGLTSPSEVIFQMDHETIPEETEDETSQDNGHDSIAEHTFNPAKSRLHRASSAESIFSMLGPKVPPLRTTPSQLLISTRPSFAHSMVSVEPVTTSMDATGRNSRTKLYDSSRYTKLLLENRPPDNRRPATAASNTAPAKPSTAIFGKKLGGWIVGKWGTTPMSSEATSDDKAQSSVSSRAVSRPQEKQWTVATKGGQATTAKVEAARLDNALLQDALG